MPADRFDSVKPFGLYGVGAITEHPVGLLVILAVAILTFVTIPPAILFFFASGLVGALFGSFLWLRHR